MSRFPLAVLLAVLILALAAIVWIASPDEAPPLQALSDTASVRAQAPVPPRAPPAPAHFISEEGCAGCHAGIVAEWRGSHHDLAMQHASAGTVLADFNNVTLDYAGVRTRFFQRDAEFWVTTDGPDGSATDYRIDYSFGVEPLQQYLVSLPGGRLQALPFAWDTTAQRWFHLYPDMNVDHRDPLHWTGPAQNWNFMCAECHSTGLEKRYDFAADSYDSRWFQIDVGCQACHGPASRHRAAIEGGTGLEHAGFDLDLSADATQQIETCARCHSRRSVVSDNYRHGDALLDHYLPALLDEGLYFADGQILDEVYVYGSFRQSRMHQAGLGCSDCHNPHSTKTHAEGNLLCVSCHNPGSSPLPAHIDSRGLQRKDYDSPAHHFHTPGQPGSFCVDCHAPQRTYMVVDPRRDHSFRIPRPDLNAKTGAPDACTGCHTEQTPDWASAAIRAQHPDAGQRGHYGLALAAGRNADSGAVRQLAALVENRREPAIVRATALQLLQRYPGNLSLTLGLANLADSDAQIRRAAVELVGGLAPQRVAPALDDAVRAVRVEAARILAAQLPANHPALRELEHSYEINAERPEALAGWSQLKLARGEQAAAEQLLVTARARNPQHLGIVLNLAELYRHSGREAQAETLLREVLADHPAEPRLTEALVLSLVRQQRRDDATRLLAQALEQHPDDPRFALLYGLLLQEGGDQARALTVFQRGLHAAPGDRQLLLALVGLQQARGDQAAARQALDRLRAINPADPALGG